MRILGIILVIVAAVLLSGCPPQNPTSHVATLNWRPGDVYPSTVQYRIYRGSTCAVLVLVSTLAQSTTTATDNTVVSGQTYCYQLSAYDSATGKESRTAPVAVTIP